MPAKHAQYASAKACLRKEPLGIQIRVNGKQKCLDRRQEPDDRIETELDDFAETRKYIVDTQAAIQRTSPGLPEQF